MTDFTYGCNNKPRPVAGKPLLVQDGWIPSIVSSTRYPNMVTVPFVMSTECQYDKSATDSGCKGCAHAPHLQTPCWVKEISNSS